jgi:hypothetical protein
LQITIVKPAKNTIAQFIYIKYIEKKNW